MSDPVIELKGLKKDYGNGRGVFDVSFSVERGEVFGFLAERRRENRDHAQPHGLHST
ncbi:MAG: hypothetical protein ACLR3C_15310 [Eggerthella lenta]